MLGSETGSQAIISVIQAAIETGNLTAVPRYRALIIINALLAKLDAPYAMISLAEPGAAGEELRILRVEFTGLWSAEDRKAFMDYLHSENHEADPFLEAYANQELLGGPRIFRRQDLVADDVWYGSEHFKTFRKAANQDAAIYCSVPEESQTDPVRIWAIYVGRRVGDRQFSEVERDLVMAVFQGVKPLLKDVWSHDSADSPVAIDFLPARLKRVATLLMSGDSTREIADHLGLSLHTIQGYVKELYGIFEVNSRAQLIIKLVGAKDPSA